MCGDAGCFSGDAGCFKGEPGCCVGEACLSKGGGALLALPAEGNTAGTGDEVFAGFSFPFSSTFTSTSIYNQTLNHLTTDYRLILNVPLDFVNEKTLILVVGLFRKIRAETSIF